MTNTIIDSKDLTVDNDTLSRICALDDHIRDTQKQVGVRELQKIINRNLPLSYLTRIIETVHTGQSTSAQLDDKISVSSTLSTFDSSQDIYAFLQNKFGEDLLKKAELHPHNFDFLLASLDSEKKQITQKLEPLSSITSKKKLHDTLLTYPLLLRLIDILEKVTQLLKDKRKPYNWYEHARISQHEPQGDWRVWLIMAGRGFGKTRTGSETIRHWVESEQCRRIALIGASESEARDVMIEGASGLLAVFPPEERPLYEPSKRRLTFRNGAIATLFSAENYEQLRGPQFDGAWIDELAKFRQAQDVWSQLNLSLRLGSNPRVIVTTTPRPTKFLRDLLENKQSEKIYVTRGSTFENADNLSKHFLSFVKAKYHKSFLGRQELEGEFLTRPQGALFPIKLITDALIEPDEIPELDRVIIAIDPAVTSKKTSDETGIIAAGVDRLGCAYILGDYSGRYSPSKWAERALEAYKYHQADAIIAEVNQGGDMVRDIIHSLKYGISVKQVRATRGKVLRAEPIVALYEQGRVKHKKSTNLSTLEDQMIHYIPGVTTKSPDRLDALVWGLTELLVDTSKQQLCPRILGTL